MKGRVRDGQNVEVPWKDQSEKFQLQTYKFQVKNSWRAALTCKSSQESLLIGTPFCAPVNGGSGHLLQAVTNFFFKGGGIVRQKKSKVAKKETNVEGGEADAEYGEAGSHYCIIRYIPNRAPCKRRVPATDRFAQLDRPWAGGGRRGGYGGHGRGRRDGRGASVASRSVPHVQRWVTCERQWAGPHMSPQEEDKFVLACLEPMEVQKTGK